VEARRTQSITAKDPIIFRNSVGSLPNANGNKDAAQPEVAKEAKEANLKKKLKNMCDRPDKKIVKFHDAASDVTLHTYIKERAVGSFKACTKGCEKLRLVHTDYWYHGTGCVSLKLIEDSNLNLEMIKMQLEQ